MRPALQLAVAVLSLTLVATGCCCGTRDTGSGSAASTRTTHRLDPYGISIDLTGHTGGATPNGYSFSSSDGSTTTQVHPAPPGPPAAQRDPVALLQQLGAQVATAQWQRPATIGGMSAIEARVVETAPAARVHWIAIIDAPAGPLVLHLFTDQRFVPDPTFGDLGWTTVTSSVRRTQ